MKNHVHHTLGRSSRCHCFIFPPHRLPELAFATSVTATSKEPPTFVFSPRDRHNSPSHCEEIKKAERVLPGSALVDGSVKGKEFAVLTIVQLCADSVRNMGLLVREDGIPPLVALSQTGSLGAKHKAETLLGYLRESRQEASSSSP